MSHRALATALLFVIMLWSRTSYSECVDYSQFLHWVCGVEVRNWINRIAVAGNYAYLVGHEFQIVDFSDQSSPRVVSHLDIQAQNVALYEEYAYVLTHTRMEIIDVSDPENPYPIGKYQGRRPANIVVAGHHAFLTSYLGLDILDLSDPISPTIVYSTNIYGAGGMAISGDVLFMTAERDLYVIDVSEPEQPRFIGTTRIDYGYGRIAVDGDLVCVGGLAGLQVVDVADPRSPRVVGQIGQGDSRWWIYGIAMSGTYAHVALIYEGLKTIDLSSPSSPRVAGSFDSRPFTQAITISDGLAFVAVDASIQVLEVAGSASPMIEGRLELENGAEGLLATEEQIFIAAGHSGLQVAQAKPAPFVAASLKTPGYAMDIAKSASHLFIADADPGVTVVDITDPLSPHIVTTLSVPGSARAVTMAEDHLFVATGSAGLAVIDVSDPQSPRLVGSMATPGYALDVGVSGNLAFLTDSALGLHVIDISDPARPLLSGTLDSSHASWRVAIGGDHVYVADRQGGIQVVDVTDPSRPVAVGRVRTPDAWSLAVMGHYLYVGDNLGLLVVDVSDPTSPSIEGYVDLPDVPKAIHVAGDRLYIGGNELDVLPVQCLSDFSEVAQINGPRWGTGARVIAPSPFPDGSSILISLASDSEIQVSLYGGSGRLVRRLMNGHCSQGEHVVKWDRRDERGVPVAKGVYFIRLLAGSDMSVAKVLLLK